MSVPLLYLQLRPVLKRCLQPNAMFDLWTSSKKVCTGISDGMEAGVQGVVGGENYSLVIICWCYLSVCSNICYSPLKSYLLEARTTLKVLFLGLGHNMGGKEYIIYICCICTFGCNVIFLSFNERWKSTFCEILFTFKRWRYCLHQPVENNTTMLQGFIL